MALKFKDESARFARALQLEHDALGELLVDIQLTSVARDVLSAEKVQAAADAFAAVSSQRARVESALGKKVG